MEKEKTYLPLLSDPNPPRRRAKLGVLFHTSEPAISRTSEPQQPQQTTGSTSHDPTPYSSPANYFMSPFRQTSPFSKSPWNFSFLNSPPIYGTNPTNRLIGSLVREEGHVYSLASSGNLLYTGSDSRNIRVWKNLSEFSGFKSSSGLVKAIIVAGDRVFTGHQDGKIRVWKYSDSKNGHKRVGSLPTTKDLIKCSINPNNYVEVRRHRNVPWIKHYDVVSCMSLDEQHGLLYSGSWDKTLRVWRLADSKCLEAVNAHDDAVNSVVVGFDGLVFTGSADGTVKVWRRELVGKDAKHVLVYDLLNQETAVTSVAVNVTDAVVYAGSSDGLVNFWERRKHALSHGGVMRGHKQAVLCLAAAGRLVFSGSVDKSICVWRWEAGGFHSCLSVLTGHGGPVKCLAVQEQVDDGGGGGDREWVVYSGSLDKSVKLWRVSEQP